VNVKGVTAAMRPVLVSYAAAIAVNARGLLDDAELLFGAGRYARA
jgi:hypothetical protein